MRNIDGRENGLVAHESNRALSKLSTSLVAARDPRRCAVNAHSKQAMPETLGANGRQPRQNTVPTNRPRRRCAVERAEDLRPGYLRVPWAAVDLDQLDFAAPVFGSLHLNSEEFAP
jgi:hypothetical protein